MGYDKRKQTFYLPSEMLDEMRELAEKYGCSLSRIFQDCYKLLKGNLHRMEWVKGTMVFSRELGMDRSRKGKP